MPKNPSQSRPRLNSRLLNPLDASISPLQEEYQAQQMLFEAQPAEIQRFIELQARQVSEMALRNQRPIRFSLPDRVVTRTAHPGKTLAAVIPADMREQLAGSVINRLTGLDPRLEFRQRLAELEESGEPGVAVAAGLLRYALVMHMVHQMLPAGRSVQYMAPEDEEIPAFPVSSETSPQSAITAATDAIVEEKPGKNGRGELQVPFVPAAQRFYLPQWVAFDDQCHLLVNSVNEAEAHLASMQSFVAVLHRAISLAPYIVADPEYQQKRFGMLGQLINQGRALAAYEAEEIIRIIRHRATSHDLNRGLSLSLPYFDDQALEMRTHDFVVIPAGRIMFAPAFVVRAAQEEAAKVAQDTRLSKSTRKYLLAELNLLEKAFTPGAKPGAEKSSQSH
jgi:hypothetical protein